MLEVERIGARGARRPVSGRTPRRSPDEGIGTGARRRALLFLVDTGLSVDVDATGGALLHVRGAGGASETWEAVLPDGTRRAL